MLGYDDFLLTLQAQHLFRQVCFLFPRYRLHIVFSYVEMCHAEGSADSVTHLAYYRW